MRSTTRPPAPGLDTPDRERLRALANLLHAAGPGWSRPSAPPAHLRLVGSDDLPGLGVPEWLAAVGPDGRWLRSCHLQLWDVATGALVASWDSRPWRGGCGSSRRARSWDVVAAWETMTALAGARCADRTVEVATRDGRALRFEVMPAGPWEGR